MKWQFAGCVRRGESERVRTRSARKSITMRSLPQSSMSPIVAVTALQVHGSLKTDIDLLAAPWREMAIDASYLAEEIRITVEKIIGFCVVRKCDQNQPERKPEGRLAWSFYLQPEGIEGPYIDLSVTPRVKDTRLRMRLLDLNPRWYAFEDQGPKVGLTFDCPHCRTQRLGIVFHERGHEAIQDQYIRAHSPSTANIWTLQGAPDFNTLTLTPSVDASKYGHWHGYITDGDMR